MQVNFHQPEKNNTEPAVIIPILQYVINEKLSDGIFTNVIDPCYLNRLNVAPQKSTFGRFTVRMPCGSANFLMILTHDKFHYRRSLQTPSCQSLIAG